MAEKTRILGQGFKRVYGCPFCAEQEKGSCECDRFCGSVLCSWKVEAHRPTVGPERPPRVQRGEAERPGVAGSAQAPGARQASGPETPPPNLMLNMPAQHTVATTSSTSVLKIYEHKTPNEIMAEYRANQKGYPEFPPNVKLGPGVWDRKGVPPAERDLKAPVADLPPGKRGPERDRKRETNSLSAWT